MQPPLGTPVLPSDLDEVLTKHPDVEAVAITHNETSIGLINPLKDLAATAKKHGKLVFVDAVSSMGGTEIKVDEWGIDVCFSSSQKCFGVPPGLGIGSVSEQAMNFPQRLQTRDGISTSKSGKKTRRKAEELQSHPQSHRSQD